MHIVLTLAGTVLALFTAAEFVPGFHIVGLTAAVIVALLLGIISVTIRPLLLLLTLPINLMTLGLFSFILNAGILLVLAQVVDGFTIDGFIPALLGGVVIALIQWLVHRFV